MRHRFKIIIFIISGFLLGNDVIGQNVEKKSPGNCPEEKMEVHISHGSAFAGELLWFKVYCTSPLFPKEELSSLAFVELINSENASLLREKILLQHGEGSGEFEIPANLPTGIYHILAYTNWMKNFGEGSFSNKELVIVNPYQPFNKAQDKTDSLKTSKESSFSATSGNKIKIIADKKIYSTRQQVSLKIEGNGANGMALSGDFSVSVYRKEPQMIYNSQLNIGQGSNKYPEIITFWPDYKGIRLSGKLLDNSDNPVPGSAVTEAIPGPGTDIKQSITDSNGDFNFLLKSREGEQEIVFTLPGQDTKMSLEESFWNGFRKSPDNQPLTLNAEAVSYLKAKFAHYQFQSRFKKQNTIPNIPGKIVKDSSVFYSNPYQLIKLNDYFVLDSLREYFHELVPSVRYSQRRNEIDISVRDSVNSSYLEDKPGVFLDGVLYNDYAAIANIPVKEVDRIAVLPKIYYYRDFSFGGIIDIHTVKSDFNSVKPLSNMTRIIFPMADACKWKFTSPDYSVPGSTSRIPDFRYLLYWEPNVKIDNSTVKVQFYTGDIKGIYIVKVIGISENGEIFQAENEIVVGD
jgi:hypothetical protein